MLPEGAVRGYILELYEGISKLLISYCLFISENLWKKGLIGKKLELTISFPGHFQLPELGPLGSNGLANSRDFQSPIACFEEDTETEWTLLSKFNGHLFAAKQTHTPFDVVAWSVYLRIRC